MTQINPLADNAEELLVLEWRDGAPPHPWDEEWFIALTTFGDRVVLRALPEEWSYDFKTADDTYLKREVIAKWMQFPDSNYIAPALQPAPLAGDEIAEAARAFVEKIEAIHQDDQYRLVWELNHIRNGPYTGPQYAEELANLKAALTSLNRREDATLIAEVGRLRKALEFYADKDNYEGEAPGEWTRDPACAVADFIPDWGTRARQALESKSHDRQGEVKP